MIIVTDIRCETYRSSKTLAHPVLRWSLTAMERMSESPTNGTFIQLSITGIAWVANLDDHPVFIFRNVAAGHDDGMISTGTIHPKPGPGELSICRRLTSISIFRSEDNHYNQERINRVVDFRVQPGPDTTQAGGKSVTYGKCETVPILLVDYSTPEIDAIAFDVLWWAKEVNAGNGNLGTGLATTIRRKGLLKAVNQFGRSTQIISKDLVMRPTKFERRTLAARRDRDPEYLCLLPGDAEYSQWRIAISWFVDRVVEKVAELCSDGQGSEQQRVRDILESKKNCPKAG